ncbi:hypothetical protein EIP91_007627 [Steccherinum ochraceum]|uniref:NadR/Ttd14 AAA domain-containing protein n=1 Tax=Steccherinum ochraceum TaxID=92696 RepID=A0A4R0RCA8_9APHY|nr:hypothetical protein EIP91_007627 [Steccherinum ochraceum]
MQSDADQPEQPSSLPSPESVSAGNADIALDDVSAGTGRAIFVLGPSSSGKTTLCAALAADLALPPSRYVTEVARHVMRTQGFSRDDTATYKMQAAIMHAQLKAEANVLKLGSEVEVGQQEVLLLSDRSAVDPVVYAATANVTTAKETQKRLVRDQAFQARLPLYQQSLFG